jgi:hypothetical protein
MLAILSIRCSHIWILTKIYISGIFFSGAIGSLDIQLVKEDISMDIRIERMARIVQTVRIIRVKRILEVIDKKNRERNKELRHPERNQFSRAGEDTKVVEPSSMTITARKSTDITDISGVQILGANIDIKV